jgi:hypothetical protein
VNEGPRPSIESPITSPVRFRSNDWVPGGLVFETPVPERIFVSPVEMVRPDCQI